MTVVNNTIERNEYGIRIVGSSFNTICNNSMILNSVYGLYIESGSHNRIYFNILAFNEETNAFDDGNDNHWNSTESGNFWSDYDGTGVYHIQGEAGSIDYHPFIYVPPETTTQTNGIIFLFISIGIVGVVTIVVLIIRLRRSS